MRSGLGALWVVWGLLSWLPAGHAAQEPRRATAPAATGTVSRLEWSADGQSVEYTSAGERRRLDLATAAQTTLEASPEAEPEPQAGGRPGRREATSRGASTGKYVGRPARGRQYTQVDSPGGKWGEWQACFEGWNVVLKHAESGETVAVTTDGNEQVYYGSASWVYGEELNQTQAMWWTPDSRKLLFYRFDCTAVQPFYLVRGWAAVGTELYPERYPKAGAPNPIAELFVYDLEQRTTVRVDVGGSPDEYVYGIRASPNGDVMLVNWTDRLQQHLKVLALDLATGATRTVVEERQATWQDNAPSMRFLEDGRRFLWPTQKSGFTHYELRDLDGRLHGAVTSGAFETGAIDFVDEAAGLVGFTAYSSPANPYYLQYHLVRLDGTDARRVTSVDLHHSSFQISPDREWLVAQYESVDVPPRTALYRADGELVAQLAESDPAAAAHLAELFSFRSRDGGFDVWGVLYKPADFDPTRKYPVINALYGGPGSNEFTPSYVRTARQECQRGYLVVKVNNRGTGRRGKAFLGATYGRLGAVDIEDHADAIRQLRERPWFDGARVGIVGHSYGGYMAAMGIVAHPDVYAAAVVRAGVTDWRNYDTIYTERYMSTPQLNPEGYRLGAAATHAGELAGKLLILHGMVDDNVHPNNAFQLIAALDEAGKSYESRFWPDGDHGLGRGANETQNAFFDRVLQPELVLPIDTPVSTGGAR